jgi:DNA mismatch repair protein MutS2
LLLYPQNITEKLEFDKIRQLLHNNCKSVLGQKLVGQMDFSTDVDWIRLQLQQTDDYKKILQGRTYFPLDYLVNIERELALLGIDNAVLLSEEIMNIRKVCITAEGIFRFFKSNDNDELYPHLKKVTDSASYEKAIVQLIDSVIDEIGVVRDNASKELYDIRTTLSKRRNDLNRIFNKIIQKLNKLGVLTETEQSFRNGRKVIAVYSENKRQLGGIIHGESDTGKTSFIEPGETVELNNEIFELERAEEREIYRILRDLTAKLSGYKPLISTYLNILAKLDFIQAKAKMAVAINGVYPMLNAKPGISLRNAYHPLLLMYNQQASKNTIPLNLYLRDRKILVISGPNAGGKTVVLKTVALLQLMVQAGLLVPCDERSEFGVFQHMFIDIGDAQSIEYELSTYSSHLKTIKYFLDYADGKTLFFIDELGTGSDPALGGAFAEVVMEELAKRNSYGIVTTHYLNLKILANKNERILNGAMSFDEENLQPLYELKLGKPGSSYTFQIAQRSGLPQPMIERAKGMVNQEHVQLDFLLNKLEQEQRRIAHKENELKAKDEELAALKEKYTAQLERAKRQEQQQTEQQKKLQNQKYVREAERELRKLLIEWQKAKDKETRDAVAKKTLEKVNMKAPEPLTKKEQKKFELYYKETGGPVKVGSLVRIGVLDKIGTVESIKDKKVTVISGEMRINSRVDDLVVVEKVN